MSSQYDFDTIIDRHHTGAMKTDVLCERYGREDLIPLSRFFKMQSIRLSFPEVRPCRIRLYLLHVQKIC